MDWALLPNLFLDHDSSDVELTIDTTAQESKAVVPAHSLVLRLASKVFKTMLENNNFKEGRTGIVELKIKGTMNDALFFLRYLYTRELEHVDLNVYVSLLQTAHMYEVDNLVRLCNERIVEQLNPFTVCEVYGSLKNVASEDVLVECKNLMLEFAFMIFKKNLHLTLEEELMTFLLASDELNALNEDQVLSALWRWGCAQIALKGCPGRNVEVHIRKMVGWIRKPLLTSVPESSPWFHLWEEGTDSNSEVDIALRQPNRKNNLNRFSHTVFLSHIDNTTKKYNFKNPSSCLMSFSVNQNILFSGFTVRITIGEKLDAPNMFRFSVNQGDERRWGSPEIILINEYTSEKAVLRESGDEYRNVKQKSYLYDLTVRICPPEMLRTDENVTIVLHTKQMLKSDSSVTCFKYPQNHVSSFNTSLKIRLSQEMVGVSQLYYFV